MADLDSQVGPYLNRLSDLLWTMARWQEGEHLLSVPTHGPDNEERATKKRARPRREGELNPMTTAPPPLEVVYAADEIEAERLAAGPVASVGVVVFEDDDGPRLGRRDSRSGGHRGRGRFRSPWTASCPSRRGFTGKVGRTLVALGAGDAPTVVYVGGGDASRSSTSRRMRRVAAAFVRAAGRSGTAVMVLPESLTTGTGEDADRRAAQAVAEGAVLATYRFVGHKSEDDGGRVDRLVVMGVGLDADAARRGVDTRGADRPGRLAWREIW